MHNIIQESLLFGFSKRWTLLHSKDEWTRVNELVKESHRVCFDTETLNLPDMLSFPCLMKLHFDYSEAGYFVWADYVDVSNARALIEEWDRQIKKKQEERAIKIANGEKVEFEW